jgi:hypothetical protein
VRQIFRLGPWKPDVAATLLSHPDGGELEFVNSGGPAHSIVWKTETAGGTAGDLDRGAATSVHLYEAADDFRCVWTALDGRGRMYVWSYDGRRLRLARGHTLSPAEAFAEMYR